MTWVFSGWTHHSLRPSHPRPDLRSITGRHWFHDTHYRGFKVEFQYVTSVVMIGSWSWPHRPCSQSPFVFRWHGLYLKRCGLKPSENRNDETYMVVYRTIWSSLAINSGSYLCIRRYCRIWDTYISLPMHFPWCRRPYDQFFFLCMRSHCIFKYHNTARLALSIITDPCVRLLLQCSTTPCCLTYVWWNYDFDQQCQHSQVRVEPRV